MPGLAGEDFFRDGHSHDENGTKYTTQSELIRLTSGYGIDKLFGSFNDPYLNMLRRYFRNPILRFFAIAVALLTALLTLSILGSQRAPGAASGPSGSASSVSKSPQRAMLDQYCVKCHNQDDRVAGLTLDTMNLDRIPEGAETWEKVVMKLRGGMMPPLGQPKPDQSAVDGLITMLETSLDRAGLAKPNPGRTSIHRLNRTEYGNAVRDLLDLDLDVAELLPPDDESNGFDNIADVLRLSPSLLEQYLSASRKISSLAMGDPATLPVTQTFRIPPDRSQADPVDGLPLGTRGGILIRKNFPLDAEYDVNVVILRNVLGYVPGLEWPHKLEVSIDGERVFLVPVGGPDDNRMSDANFATAAEAIDARTKIRLPLKAGPHTIGVAFLKKASAESDEPLQLHTRDHDLQNMNGIPQIDHVDITGPFKSTGSGDTPSRRRILSCRPTGDADESACARKILSTLARRAYRQPVAETDMSRLMEIFQSGRKKGTFESGIENGLQVILTSPRFLFRTEIDPANVAAGASYKLGDLELASRLSFFLWSSIPDEELLGLAEKGRLREPSVLDAQVQRMLADPRSNALVSNFAGQWLFLRNLQSARPDGPTFPNFDDNLRQAYRRETEMLFESIMRENRSVVDLLNANYTFVNERLAKAVRHSQRIRQPVPACDADGSCPLRTSWSGECTHGNFVSESDLSGAARQVDHGKHIGHAASAASAGSAAA